MRLAALLIFIGFFTRLKAEDTIIITTQIWPPYQTFENDSLGGDATETLREIFDSLNIPYRINVYPWKRAQLLVQNGEADAFFLASQNEKRDAYASVSIPLFEQKWVWYYLKDSKLKPGSTTFRDKAKVSANVGSNMFNWLRKNGYYTTISDQTTSQLLDRLLAKRVDAILANSEVMQNILDNRNINSLEIDSTQLYDKPLRVYFSHKYLNEHKDFLDEFNSVAEQVLIQKKALVRKK